MNNKLWHPDYDKTLNGFSLRGIGLSTQGYKLQKKLDKKIKKAKLIILTVILCFVFMASAYVAGRWIAWDKGYDFAIKNIYSGNAEQVEQNKKKAYKEVGITGAGDQGQRKVWEGK